MSVKDHDINCGWQFEQYDFECDCGATRPRAPNFIPFEPYKLPERDALTNEQTPAAPIAGSIVTERN